MKIDPDVNQLIASIRLKTSADKTVQRCAYSRDEILPSDPICIFKVAEESNITANGQNIAIPVQNIIIHAKYVYSIKENLEQIYQQLESNTNSNEDDINMTIESEFLTVTSNSQIDSVCLYCGQYISNETLRVIFDRSDLGGFRFIQCHINCLPKVCEKLDRIGTKAVQHKI